MGYEAKYGLPSKVSFCQRCVVSNQRPASAVEFKHKKDSKKTTINMNSEGVCDACLNHDRKNLTDWKAREEQLLELLDKHRKNDGSFDCLVPGSGGKDSAYQAHVLKYKYGMNPLTVTWPPILYTEYGYKNWLNWVVEGGFDNIKYTPNGRVMKLLTKLSIENLMHPFQTFILGQKNLGPKIAAKYGIDLVFYGENEAEYGNPIADNNSSLRDKSFYAIQNMNDIYLGGVSIQELVEKYDVRKSDLMAYLPATADELSDKNIEVHYLGYYLNWIPQEVYYYAVENTGFKARPFRTEGTYSKYSSIDDKIDDLHYFTTFIKFGIGRATYDAAQEIRNKHITREEGQLLVDKFDGEVPTRYLKEILEYLELPEDRFWGLVDEARSPHLWAKVNGEWKLRHTVNLNGCDD